MQLTFFRRMIGLQLTKSYLVNYVFELNVATWKMLKTKYHYVVGWSNV